MIRPIRNVFMLLLAVWAALAPSLAQAKGLSLIRDAEIEHTLRLYGDPVFAAAGLTPENIHLFIINDPTINAFVAGGSNMFLHTGLLAQATSPDTIIGVMAHEAGHIAGGHLANGAENFKDAKIGTILSVVLGAAAALGGSADAGMGVLAAGSQLSQRSILSYTRMNEQAADQSAMTSLDSLGYSVDGLLSLLEKMRARENLYVGQIDPYTLTHPLSRERIATLRGHQLQMQGKTHPTPPEFSLMFQRMQAKLEGFIDNPTNVLAKYPASDTSETARYARSIAYHRQSLLTDALREVDALLAGHPEYAFYTELKAQILFESGKLAECLPLYRKADKLFPHSALLEMELGQALLGQTPPQTDEAIAKLKDSTLQDNSNVMAWRTLASAYNGKGDAGQAALAQAEGGLAANDPQEAQRFGKLALQQLPAASPSRLRAQDLLIEAARQKRQNEQRGTGQNG